MDGNDASNLIAAAAVLVAIGALLVADTSRRTSARQAQKADVAAERAAEMSQRSTEALERMSEQFAASLSQQEKRDRRQWSQRPMPGPETGDGHGDGPWMGLPPVGPSEPVVHWTVDKVQGRLHRLRNLGRATGYEVELSIENAVRFDGPEIRDIHMGEDVEFLAIGSMQTGTPELLVKWRDSPDGQLRTWRRLLP